jgi:5-methylthioadenosine/S-adenosylhomocysteine deaminase
MGLAPIDEYMKRDIPIGLATDGAASNSTLDIMEQMRLMVLFMKYLTEDGTYMPLADVVDIAFRSSAKVMHLKDKIGEIKPGLLADVVLLRQDGLYAAPKVNPLAALVYTLRASDVNTVICNGKVLMQDRKLLTLDKEEIKKQVQSRVQRLSKRVTGKRVAYYPA